MEGFYASINEQLACERKNNCSIVLWILQRNPKVQSSAASSKALEPSVCTYQSTRRSSFRVIIKSMKCHFSARQTTLTNGAPLCQAVNLATCRAPASLTFKSCDAAARGAERTSGAKTRGTSCQDQIAALKHHKRHSFTTCTKRSTAGKLLIYIHMQSVSTAMHTVGSRSKTVLSSCHWRAVSAIIERRGTSFCHCSANMAVI